MDYNLVGKKFGELTVVEEIKGTKTIPKKWKCVCSCGQETYATTYALTSGKKKSCGDKIHRPRGNTTRLLNKKFGRLTVISFSHFDEKCHKDYWNCVCDCGSGKNCVVQGYNLTSGIVQSCGCLSKEYTQKVWFNDLTGQKYGDLTVLEYVGRKNLHSYWKCRCSCGKEIVVTANNLRRNHTTSCGHNLHSISGTKEENEIKDYILSLNNTASIEKARHILDTKYEIDIYLPEYSLGIEYNGSVYHASLGGVYSDLAKDYHRNKFLLAKEKGIHLLNIFDVDWQTKKEKIKAVIKDIIIPPTRLYARKCVVKQIDRKISDEFCKLYHLQSASNLSIINYGLYYNSELYAVISLGKLRLKKQKEKGFEIHRYCVKSNYTIIGGAEKLLSQFESDYHPQYLLSYSDNDYFTGQIYNKIGFKFSGYPALPYYWFYKNCELKREKCQVHILKEHYPELYKESIENNASNKEDYIMLRLGAKKVYRSGNTKWEKFYV